MFNEYPYINLNDLNLDSVLKGMKDLKKAFEDFASTNGLKVADPITWSITNAYAPNTIVVTNDGNAFISRASVPSGILLTNTDYWIRAFEFPTSSYHGDSETLEIGGNVDGDTREYFSKLAIGGATVKVHDADAHTRLNEQDETIAAVNGRIDDYHIINVVDHGADPTGVRDNAQILADIMANNEACLIYFPKGDYKFTEGITITKPFKFLGEMAAAESIAESGIEEHWLKGVVLHTPDTSNFSMFKVRCSGVQIENFCISSEGFHNTTSGIKIGLGHTGKYKCLVFKNLYFRSVTYGVLNDAAAVFKSVFENIWVWGCVNGFRFDFGTHTSLTFLNCWTTWCSSYGYWIAPGKLVYSSLINCACDNFSSAYYFKNLSGCSIIACGCEIPTNASGDCIEFRDCDTVSAQFNIIFKPNGVVKNSGRLIYVNATTNGSCHDLIFHDCYAQDMPIDSVTSRTPFGVQSDTKSRFIRVYNFVGVNTNQYCAGDTAAQTTYTGVQHIAIS